eukprot:g26995.t1
MVRVSGIGFVTEAKAQEVSEFWKAKKVYQNVQKALAQTVEGICSNAKFGGEGRDLDRRRGGEPPVTHQAARQQF